MIWWLFDGYLMAIWWLSDGYLMAIWWLFDGYLMAIWWLFDGYLMAIWWLSDGYLMAIWWLFHGYFLLCIPHFQTHPLFHRWTHLQRHTNLPCRQRRATKGQEIAPLFLASVGSTRIMSPCNAMAHEKWPSRNWRMGAPYHTGPTSQGFFSGPTYSLYGTNVPLFYNVEPPVISWFRNPIHYSCKYHKP